MIKRHIKHFIAKIMFKILQLILSSSFETSIIINITLFKIISYTLD